MDVLLALFIGALIIGASAGFLSSAAKYLSRRETALARELTERNSRVRQLVIPGGLEGEFGNE